MSIARVLERALPKSPSANCPAGTNALYDAQGVRVFDLPITPEKVLGLEK